MTPRTLALAALFGVVLLRLLTALAPAEPMLLGVPLGLALELLVVGAATASLWLFARAMLPDRGKARPTGGRPGS